MIAGWSNTPVLGSAPSFHADPTVGGPPMLTPDGHWRWNGEVWVVVEVAPLDPSRLAAPTRR